jgi:hypothetical protein
MKKITKENSYTPMTKCTKPGIKIIKSDNDYKQDPFAGVDPFKIHTQTQTQNLNVNVSQTPLQKSQDILNSLDLNIENYSREELYKLFGLQNAILTEQHMKEAKKLLLKTHPDKSNLDMKYFIFFSKAFDKIKQIYEFQNKFEKKSSPSATSYDSGFNMSDENNRVLSKMFEQNKDLKKSDRFNEWFNQQFDKNKLDDPIEKGYGDWLKSDEDIVFTPQNVNKDTMAREIEKRKKEVQSMIKYEGVSSYISPSSCGTALMEYDGNYTSNSLFSGNDIGYTDLKQAYVESVIPISESEFSKIQTFKDVNSYKAHRDRVDISPLDKEESMRQLYHQNKKLDEESAALAFYYAQQSEKAKQSSDNFWSSIKQLTNW